MLSIKVLLIILFYLNRAYSKLYERCELAKELLDVHEIPMKQLATWVCIAEHESNYNTSAINKDSGDHGLLQISQIFWCSPPGYACGVSCSDLRNDDIEDDVICARRIYREHKRLSGDGFNAWVVYSQYCRGDVSKYISGCLDKPASTDKPTSRPPTSNKKQTSIASTTENTTPKNIPVLSTQRQEHQTFSTVPTLATKQTTKVSSTTPKVQASSITSKLFKSSDQANENRPEVTSAATVKSPKVYYVDNHAVSFNKHGFEIFAVNKKS